MEITQAEEEAVRRFVAATLGMLKALRTADNARLATEIRRIAREDHELEVEKGQTEHAAKPLLLNEHRRADGRAFRVP